jgi:hypothetical protein
VRGQGVLRAAEARAGFSSASLLLSPATVEAALLAMSASSGRADGGIAVGAFVRGAFALSLRARALRPRAAYAVFPDSAFRAESATGCLRARRAAWALLEEPSSSPAARTLAAALGAAVVASVATFIAETYPRVVAGAAGPALAALDVALAALFSAEYATRLACAPSARAFAGSFFGLVDALALAPFYAELVAAAAGGAGAAAGAGAGAALLRALRLLRLLRLLKLGRHVAWLRVFGATVRASAPPLAMLAFVTGTLLLLWSSFAYYAERGAWDAGAGAWLAADGAPSQYASVPASAWWAVISMTTVGYGDHVAVTAAGKVLSFFAVISGIVCTAIPIGIITGNLAAESQRVDRLRALRAEHAAAAAARKPPPPAHAPAPAPEPAPEPDADRWSEEYLRSALLVVRASRRRFMAALKKLELANREKTVAEVRDLVADLAVHDRAEALRRSERRGLA